MKRKNTFASPQPAKKNKENETTDLSQLENSTIEKTKILSLLDDGSSKYTKIHQSIDRIQQFLKTLHNTNNFGLEINDNYFSIIFPQIVIVGMQKDGKSSLVESLTGLQFIPIEEELGTRRPLIIKINHDQKYEQPLVQFFPEEEESGNKKFEKPIPVQFVPKEIQQRTKQKCDVYNISATPIVVRMKYKQCQPMHIYDTIGLRKNENGLMCDRIRRTIELIVKPKNRIIICVQEKKDFDSDIVNLLKEYDENEERTIFVFSKLDILLNQIKRKETIEEFLAVDEGKKNVFFTSLHGLNDGRNLSDKRFKEVLMRKFLNDVKVLKDLKLFEKHEPKIGIFKLKSLISELLARKNVECIKNFINKMDMITKIMEKRIKNISDDISSKENTKIEQDSIVLIGNYVKDIMGSLRGTVKYDPETNGQTLGEEIEDSQLQWPDANEIISILCTKVRNNQYKLYGGSQIERLLAEFEKISYSQEFPETDDNEVAVSVGLSSYGQINFFHGASDLADKKSTSCFLPLVDILLKRSEYIMKRLFKMVSENLISSMGVRYGKFFEFLENGSVRFVELVSVNVKRKICDQFKTFSKIIDLDFINESKQNLDYDLLEPKAEDTKNRVQNLTNSNNQTTGFKFPTNQKYLDEKSCKQIKLNAAKIFCRIRDIFVKYILAKYNAFFLTPLFDSLDNELRKILYQKGKDEVRILLGDEVPFLKIEKEKLLKNLEYVKIQRRFIENSVKEFLQ